MKSFVGWCHAHNLVPCYILSWLAVCGGGGSSEQILRDQGRLEDGGLATSRYGKPRSSEWVSRSFRGNPLGGTPGTPPAEKGNCGAWMESGEW